MDNFDYKKYSLENLEKWMSDALLSSEATPNEIYDVIKGVVDEEYHYFKNQTSRCYELLALLNGNGGFNLSEVLKEREYYEGCDTSGEYKLTCDKNDKSPECQSAWNDFWEENYYPEEHSQYTEEELNAMCDKAVSDDDKNKCREYNLREAEYYNQRAELDAKWKPVSVPSKPLYVSEDGDVWIPDSVAKKDKVVKWQLPVEVDGLTGDCLVQFPDDLLEAANLKEGDTVEWIDRKDGSFELRKVNGTK
jgi:hypothetical protein